MRNKILFIMMLVITAGANADNLLYDITDGKFRPDKSQIPVSMNDGEHYTLMVDDQTIVKYNYKTGAAVDTLLSINKVKVKLIDSFSGYIMSPKETKILVYKNEKKRYRRSFTAEYYIYDIKYKEFDPLSSKTPQEAPVFSADDRYIAFAHSNNLHMKKVDFKTDIQITKDGEAGKISNGISDWLYEEEFETTYHYDWCPDSKLLAFVKFDERDVKEFTFQTFLQKDKSDFLLYPEHIQFKYPKAGEKNPTAIICIYDDFNKTTRTIDLKLQNDYYIPRIKWTSNANQLAIFQMNRNQNRLNMFFANPKTGIARLITREESKTYIDYQNINLLQFRKDNSGFYSISDRDGYRHIYQHRMDGTIARQITKGNWDITNFYGVDERRNIIYYQSAELSPVQRNIFSIDAKGKKVSIAEAKGKNDAWFSTGFNYFVHEFSSITQPNIFVLRNSNGSKIRNLKDNSLLATTFQSFQLNNKDFFSFSTSDNIKLNGWMLKPTGFDPEKKYPVLMIQYSGPGSQLAINQWNIGWEYYLSTKGYMVVCVDGRGTGSRGADFMKSTYKQLGILEARDQTETAKYLSGLTYVDKSRIGIWGWSYGGSVVLWAMSSGENVFKAGISVAPVTDWRFYNTAYTERFMQTPEENFSGYEETSAVLKADQLEGRLLIIHGTADDNVHYNNTLIYTDKLVEAGKQFEMQIYTDKNHSITGKQTRRHLYTRMSEFLFREL